MNRWTFILVFCISLCLRASNEIKDTELQRSKSYLGRGYDLLLGNPLIVQMGKITRGAPNDPGLSEYKVLAYNLVDSNATDEKNDVRCHNEEYRTLTTQSFRNRILQMFRNKEDWHEVLRLYAAFSSATESFSKETVFLEKYLKCTSAVRYKIHPTAHITATGDFQRAVCSLPASSDGQNEDSYKKLFLRFGTSVITSVVLGRFSASLYSNKYTQMPSFYEQLHRGTLAIGATQTNTTIGSYVNITRDVVNSLNEDEIMANHPKDFVKWEKGLHDVPSDLELGLDNIDKYVDLRFWSNCGEVVDQECCDRLPELRKEIRKALDDYPRMLDAKLPKAEVRNPLYRLSWPLGTYSLIQTRSGCPGLIQFKWQLGVVQHTQGSYTVASDNISKALPTDFVTIVVVGQRQNSRDIHTVKQSFCTKTVRNESASERPWPNGSYCIHKYGQCPSGFESGYVYWDDDHLRNHNRVKGIIPDGEYGGNTLMYFCCRSDGPAEQDIILPVHQPFFLLRYKGICQRVKWTNLVEGNVFFDASWLTAAHSYGYFNYGSHPDNEMRSSNNVLFYCYYTPEKSL